MKQLRVAVVGVGYLGRYHAEKYAALPETELVGVVDPDEERGRQLAQHLNTAWFPGADRLPDSIDAVSIVVPTALHHQVALPFLNRGVHVLLEKPITVTLSQADELIDAAARKNVILQIGHIERFNPAVAAFRHLLAGPRYMAAERSAPFTPRCTDVNVVLDLMIHDLDIVSKLAGAKPREVCAAGASVITKEIDTATARIVFENGCIADVTASRISDEKRRVLRVFDSERLYTADYQTQKAAVMSAGGNGVPAPVFADIATDRSDTLLEEIKAFVRSVQSGAAPLVSGAEGRTALALAQTITDAITSRTTGFVPVSVL